MRTQRPERSRREDSNARVESDTLSRHHNSGVGGGSQPREDCTMSRVRPTQPATPPAPRGVLCPYCGRISVNPRRCDGCGGFFDPLSRQATQNAMGPWYLRDPAHPFRPGCSYETVRDLVKRGRIRPDTILRGPATRQFWNFAARTPTVANLLGL